MDHYEDEDDLTPAELLVEYEQYFSIVLDFENTLPEALTANEAGLLVMFAAWLHAGNSHNGNLS